MKVFSGEVVSKNSEKTATVVVERFVSHPLYKKRFKRTKKYQVHDEIGCAVGQRVSFVASRPHSKTKKWKIIKIRGGVAPEKKVDKKKMKLKNGTALKSKKN
jgi:small subunit ribosomal protein S17